MQINGNKCSYKVSGLLHDQQMFENSMHENFYPRVFCKMKSLVKLIFLPRKFPCLWVNTKLLYYCSHLLPDYKKKFKTKACKDTTDPVWNEKFVFEKLKLEDLRSNRVVELTVWDLSKNKQYDFIGGLRLGPRPHHDNPLPYMDSSDTELRHWMSVMDSPGQSIEQLHTLRHNMDPRTITIATSEPSKEEITNATSANKEVPRYDVTKDVIGSHDPVPVYEVTMGSHDPEPRYESMPVTGVALVTQPSITVSTEDSPPPDVKASHHGNEHSPVRTEKLKFDDEDDDHSSTLSHQVIP